MTESANGHRLAQLHARHRTLSRPLGQEAVRVRGIPAPLTVLLADVALATRRAVRSVLDGRDDILVVGEAASADEAVTKASQHRPNVLMIDLDPGDPAGIEVISRLVWVAPETGILIYSTVENDASIRSAIQAGARGYLIKGAGTAQLLRGIHAVAAGEVIVGSTIAGRFRALLRQLGGPEPYPFPTLTMRERDVLELIAAGRSNPAIARELRLAPKTISNRVSTIFSKLGVADRPKAIILARDAGLGHGNSGEPHRRYRNVSRFPG